jgi:hypothetical protein
VAGGQKKVFKNWVYDSVELWDAVNEPVFGGVTDEGVLVIEEVKHDKETYLIEVLEDSSFSELDAALLPENRESLDGQFLVLEICHGE